MKVNDIKIKGAKAEGNYKLKGFEKDDIYIGKEIIYKRQKILFKVKLIRKFQE